ncbi:putative short-chain dehydrogenase/reductase family protein [Mariannaea sp. PMI_226]|nr:putative short-chain dehydrogenase/reductase family protein [Mariannaea sp. PMI_226]
MPSKCNRRDQAPAAAGTVPSKLMDPLPENFGPVFFQNQFKTKIELPTKEKFPNLEGKCAIITGSNTGLGFESARQLLGLGLSHLVMAVRTLERGEAAASKLRPVNPSARIDVWQLDMEKYDSIQSFVARCETNLSCIDMVILNAGMAPVSFATASSTGHEKAVQVNFLSTVLLAVLLLPVLKRQPSRDTPILTIVNSVTAHLCKFPNRTHKPVLPSFDDTNVLPWDPQERYGVSKLLGQLFIVKLADNVDPNDVVINMVDPGLTKGTGLARDAKGLLGVAAWAFNAAAGRPVEKGAATYVDAVLKQGKQSHGCFLMNCKISPLARLYYTEGETLTDVIWKETLEELKFAGIEQIIASMGYPKVK